MLLSELSTETVAARERFALWAEASLRSHTLSRLRSDHADDFRAHLRTVDMGDSQISALSFPSLETVRTPKLIRQNDPEVYLVNCVLKGMGQVSQAGSQATFRAGEIVLVDSSRPYRSLHSPVSDTVSSVVLQIPRSLLPLPRKTVQRVLTLPVSGRHGVGGVFWRWLGDLNARAAELTPADTTVLASVTADLLASLLGRCAEAEEGMTPEARRRALRVHIRDFIRQHLGDPALSPAAIAAAHQISVRHLYQLFAAEGTTPAAWIRRSRLERCRRDLADPGLRRRSVQDISAWWGFTDPAHFSRLFRAAYGMPPSDYRHQALSHPVHTSATTVR